MDPFTEIVLMLALMVGVPALIVHWLCRKIEYKIATWRPKVAFTGRRRYDLVQIIPAPNNARRREAAANWWPRDTWQA